jgi:hypothetical protein
MNHSALVGLPGDWWASPVTWSASPVTWSVSNGVRSDGVGETGRHLW